MRVGATSSFLLFILGMSLCFLLACGNDFDEKNIEIGTKGSSSSSGSSSEPLNDDDADGINNGVEEDFGMTIDVADSDHDGFSDGFELALDSGDPLDASVSPSPDITPDVKTLSAAREDGVDTDGDGLGDKFEQENLLDLSEADSDSDGYNDGLELLAGSNPFVKTSKPIRTNAPTSDGEARTGNGPKDTDSDGISDTIENLLDLTSSIADTDGDGFSDAIEFFAGSDATSALSIPDFNVPTPTN